MGETANPLVRVEHDETCGLATLTLCGPGGVNKIDHDFGLALLAAVEGLRGRAGLTGVLVVSGHREFCVGADLTYLYGERDPARLLTVVLALTRGYRALETLGVPVAAALTGSALGGGFELALACHHRVALDDARVKLGLPEVSLGVLPGAGGTQRLPRLLGFQAALELITQASVLPAPVALKKGLVHALAPTPEAVVAACRAWLLAHPGHKAPWDSKGFTWPPPAPDSEDARNLFMAGSAMLFKKTAGAYPAAEAAMAVAQEGARLSLDRALELEARAFVRLAVSDGAKDMIRTFFFHKNAADKLDELPAAPEDGIARVAVLGAGMMGAGLAWICALAGVEVLLRDISQAALDRGMAHCAEQAASFARKKGPAAAEAALARIRPVLEVEALRGTDLVIEAVFEDIALKHRVIREVEPVLAPGALFASNTSALPIGDLARASAAPERFLGLHFFSPVERMPLIEVIEGPATGQEALGRALAFCRRLKKTPILVGDGFGFYTTRVFAAYILEGAELVAEGHDPAALEWAARTTGMAVPPLQVFDEISLTLGKHVVAGSRPYLGERFDTAGAALVLRMVDEAGRAGRAAGAGFYDYVEGKRQGLWAGLEGLVSAPARPVDVEALRFRLLAVQAAEVARVLDAGILRRSRDAELGAVLGLGFAPPSGGPLAWMDRQGLPALVARLDDLAARHGPRYAPCTLLRELAARGGRFYPA
ncbi:MAG: 3-hydroxyacyl-CoA dehydrogenase NAD-binding domain-containing protein [Pseudomonadota bacterium]